MAEDLINGAACLHEGAETDEGQRDQWRRAVAKDDAALFQKRLEWQEPRAFEPDSTWLPLWRDIEQRSAIEVACSLLDARSSPLDLLSERAYGQLHDWLADRLSQL